MFKDIPDNHPFILIKNTISKVWEDHTRDHGVLLVKKRLYKLTYNDESIIVKLVAASSGFSVIYFDVIIENNRFPYMKPPILGMHACIQAKDFLKTERIQIEQI